ncbi:hypothetical protein ABID49_001515 [Bhargavaea ullalensis]|uniref:Uncharacterized protein n=1 Tax=Bhargavaea ullalensis TaxID=1265685 RepID=A0ABV2GBF4_9BACL
MTERALLDKEQIKELVLNAMNFRHATKEYDENK